MSHKRRYKGKESMNHAPDTLLCLEIIACFGYISFPEFNEIRPSVRVEGLIPKYLFSDISSLHFISKLGKSL